MKVDLSELRALEQAATPGLWEVGEGQFGKAIHEFYVGARRFGNTARLDDVVGCRDEAAANAALIVALRNAAPALLDAYAERDRLREALTRERVAEAIWDSLVGDTHDGSEPIDGIGMKYSSPDVRNRIYRMTDAVSALLTDHSEEGR